MRSPILIGIAAVILGASGGWAEDATPDPLPLESDGDLSFHVDFAGFRGAEVTDQEVYVSVTNDQIGFSESGSVLEGELKLEIVVRTEDGERVVERESSLTPQAGSEFDADDRGILQIIREPLELAPGLYHFEVKLTDEKTLRTGLFNKMRNSKQRATADGWVEVHDFTRPGLVLSDLTMVRSSPFEPGTSFLVRTRVLDRSDSPVLEKTTRAVPHGEAFVITDELPLSARHVAAGHYTLEVEVFNETTGETVRARRGFDVIWSVSSWGQDPDELFQEMALLMRDSEYKKLQALSPGAREIYLAEYWRELDPDPDSPENEALTIFRQRVALADREFESTLQRGILTDRGRVFVRYGAPDDVNFEYNSSGFGLDGSGERVAGPGERQALSGRPSSSFLDGDQFREGDVSGVANQTGGVNIKAKALEVWEYDGQGHPLTPQQLEADSHRGLKFIFADEMGDGTYGLISSEGAVLF
jgi:GWxTD domain-containing protein